MALKAGQPARRVAANTWLGVLLLLIAVSLLSCNPFASAHPAPAARDGQIDLSQWSFETKGPAVLRGMWRFAWLKDDPNFARTDFDDSHWDTIDSQEGFNRKVHSREGYAWMRLHILLPPNPTGVIPLALDMLPFSSCSEVYLDGVKLFTNGRVATTNSEDRIAEMMPRLLPISVAPGQREIVIAVRGANYDRLVGGMTDSPRLGRLDQLQLHRWRKDLWDTVVVGIYVLLILYHVFFWLYRREDFSSLYFSAWCTCVLLRMTSLNFFFERTFPHFDIFALRFKFEYMGPALAMFTPAFYAILYPKEFPKRIVQVSNVAAVAEFLFPIPLSLHAFSAVLPVYQKVVGFSLIVTCTVITIPLIMVLVRRRQGAFLVWGGWIPICWGAMNDLAYDWGLPVTGNRIQYVGLIFVILNAVVLAIRSATAFRTAEHLSANLQQEVDAKTVELKKKNIQLQDLDRQKTLLFQNISHEFRTPLTLIIGPLTAALGADHTGYSPLSREQSMVMLRNSQRLLQLINQLLDLSKLEAGKMQLLVQKNDLVKMLLQVVSSFESLAARKKIHFDFVHDDDRVEVYFDPEKMEKVFFNLLSNAFKFTADGGKIQIRLSHRGQEALVRFADTGVGIPAEELPHIFERFRQVDASSTRQFGGTGIGLALVKEYVDLHHGRVDVESRIGRGTEFTVVLRLGAEHFAAEQLASEETEAPSPGQFAEMDTAVRFLHLETTGAGALAKAELGDGLDESPATSDGAAPTPEFSETILIVEDNRDMRSYIKQTLQAQFRIREACDGEEGLQKAREFRPDLILTDVMMPKMDGYALIRALAQQPETKRIPIIVLTAKASEEMKIEGLQEGAHDFLSKPFNPKELAARIGNLLALVRKEKEIDLLNRRLRENILKRYLPPALIEQILAGQTGLDEKPQSLPVTILFSDLEKFTKASADLRAQEMARLLNEYLGVMIEVIFRHGGTIDKFIGDSIMVIFGAPCVMSPVEQVTRAAACAVAMQNAMDRLDRDWKQRGVRELQMRIGMHHGPVVVGNFGNQRRLDFTAVGPAVNFASRIESVCAPGQVYVSGDVCDYLPSRSFEKVGNFTLKNIEGEVALYRLLRDAKWEEFFDAGQ